MEPRSSLKLEAFAVPPTRTTVMLFCWPAPNLCDISVIFIVVVPVTFPVTLNVSTRPVNKSASIRMVPPPAILPAIVKESLATESTIIIVPSMLNSSAVKVRFPFTITVEKSLILNCSKLLN